MSGTLRMELQKSECMNLSPTPDEQIQRLYDVGRNQQELMAALLQGSRIILENSDFNVTLKMLFEKCKSMIHASIGFVSILEPVTGRSKTVKLDQGAGENISLENLPLFFEDLLDQARGGKCSVLENDYSGTHHSIKNILIVPLLHDQVVVGFLALCNKPEDFDSEDVAVAESFAELIALARVNSMNIEDLKVARRKAEESDRLKSAFLSNMSHEIRTPLNGILGFSELLADPGLDVAEREQYVRIMNQNGEQLISIINNILDISLIESGQIVLSNEWTDVRSLISEVYELFQAPGLKKQNVHYVLDCDKCSERLLLTDAGRLRQILINLFGNATKFTQSGHVIMGCRILGNGEGQELVISVEDTGIGIPAEKLETVFERFRQADRNTKRHFGGTGLGLAISRGLTELLGGRMEVESKPMKGSTFRVIFPI